MDAPANEHGIVAGDEIPLAAESPAQAKTDVKAASGDVATTGVPANADRLAADSAKAADSSTQAKNGVKPGASEDGPANVDATPPAAERSAAAKIDDKPAAPGNSTAADAKANVDGKTAKSETSVASGSSSAAKKGGSIHYVKLPPGWEGLSIKLSGNRCVISEVPKACFSSGALVEKGAIKNQVEGVEVGDEVVSFNGESPARLLEKIQTKGDAWNACSSAKPPHEVGSKTKFDSPPCAACDFIRRRKQLGFDVALQMWLRSVKREISFTLGVRPASEIPAAEEESAPSLNATADESAKPVKRLKSLASLDDCIEGEKKSTVVALQASSESTSRMEKALERLKMLSELDDKTRDKKYKQASKGKGKGKGEGKKGKRPTGPYLERTRLTEKLVTGEVTEWKGKYGWIKPHEPVDHPKANLHKGKLYVHKVDLEWWVDSLTVGSFCRFHVYSDANSLGAEECTELKEASANSEDWSDWKDSDWKNSDWNGGDQSDGSNKRKR
eukprot:TRINITY_DN26666_c0_g1_i1.p1 TRINITY_DN26666_c0_g1~~TRINITY_DN26666_c0_g1_i1.p1  ORF type:complete len:501 (-),score=97.89 TRINITY_DN26666_c0_g1_i1:222-1724(-)